eukprot:CAMPEP_0194529830 /NCGR_PEP_ID=MMETSP0253-20130528/66616_1 /TAXON_ID=2966 /ORGANISM="Noctiluca scintillans" /LENGTH=436 /DNA_ID=CAMNT_0039374999 /DNA_START=8 /DNA_END=1318 /DNA_ORIENTATION=-
MSHTRLLSASFGYEWNPWWLVVLTLLAVWSVAELLFFIWFVIRLRDAQEQVEPLESTDAHRRVLLDQMLLHAGEYGILRQIEGWFDEFGPDVGQEDVSSLLAWAFFFKNMDDLDDKEREWVALVRRKFDEQFGLDHILAPGSTGAKLMRHTMDPVRAIHHPLLFYAIVHGAKIFTRCLLRSRGFRRSRHGDLHYWYFVPDDPYNCEEPLIFFHGIGIGLFQYIPLLLKLPTDRAQFLFELEWISMNPLAVVPTSDAYARWVVEVLAHHDVTRCTGMGHSFGSLPITWLLRWYPGLLSRCVLLDPVAMLLNLPDVCMNCLYRRPKTALGWFIRFVYARELGLAKTFMRQFFWTEHVLFPNMLPRDSSVILMGEDCLLPVDEIYAATKRHTELNVEVFSGLDHAGFLRMPSVVHAIVDHLRLDLDACGRSVSFNAGDR